MIQVLLDISGILACVSIEEFLDFTLKIVECSMSLMRKKSQILGKPVTQHVFIFDLEGFSLKVRTIHIDLLLIICYGRQQLMVQL